jgi:hypothetical protein
VLDAYLHLGLPIPEICFITSPSPEQISILHSSIPKDTSEFIYLKRELINRLVEECQHKTRIANENLNFLHANREIDTSVRGEIFDKLCDILYEKIIYESNLPNANFHKMLSNENAYRTNSWFYDLYIEEIIRDSNIYNWHMLKSLNIECPYLIAYDRICIIIEKPCELYLDQLFLPHADGKPAIKYTDGYELFCHHGVVIPAKYGKFHSDDWQAQWILNEQQSPTNKFWEEHEELGITLRLGIGYKEFDKQLPNSKNVYWRENTDGYWEKSGDPRWSTILQHTYCEVIFEWILFYCCEYYNGNQDFDWSEDNPDIESIITTHSLQLSEELHLFYKILYKCDYPLIPGLDSYSLMESSKNLINGFNNRPALKLFTGCRGEIYYAICPETQETFSTIYCQLPEQEPMVYAECLTSLMMATAQCYQKGAYCLKIDTDSGEKTITQDLDEVEKIFEKFNPNQIDNWRSIWKEY